MAGSPLSIQHQPGSTPTKLTPRVDALLKKTLRGAYRVLYSALWTLDSLDIRVTETEFSTFNFLDSASPSFALVADPNAASTDLEYLRHIHSVRDALCHQLVALAECARDARCLHKLYEESRIQGDPSDKHKVATDDKKRLKAAGYDTADYLSAYDELNRLGTLTPRIAIHNLNSLRTTLSHSDVLDKQTYKDVWKYVNGTFLDYAAAIENVFEKDNTFQKLDLPERRKAKRKRNQEAEARANAAPAPTVAQSAQPPQPSNHPTRSQVLDHFGLSK